ncbi:hypothetical protein MPSEU_000777900 [Mayamaea pseudoterrestris]|nr:hypothetical protein MPSEU_000777900 [Mayamaea pseudoterrestris]
MVGTGTFVDPDLGGGTCNEAARKSLFQPVSKIDIDGQQNLLYKALPINVAIIRATTADTSGNLTIERESLMCDQMNTAMAARNSGGIVIAQVMRLAKNGSLNPKQVAVPAPLVDCVVVVDEEDQDELHSMSFVERYNPSLTGQIRSPEDAIAPLPMSQRKVIARRAFFELKPDMVVNLGIGLPEGVARVAAEEDMLDYITLSTEPGVFGGLPASGHSFGPAYNPAAVIEMNQMFDFYDGGGLDISFLGAAQISPRGDVNVSRMSKDRLTGPGGFIDISQSTDVVMFMSPLTASGLDVTTTKNGKLIINKEGSIKKFVNMVGEVTFSGDEAVRRGQKVLYVTERAVFRRSSHHPVLELIEIAPGVDLQKDVLNQIEFEPVVSSNLKLMDRRIFLEKKMNAASEIFGSFKDRFSYHAEDNVMFLNLCGISLNSDEDMDWYFRCLRETFGEVKSEHGKMNMVINYDGLNLNGSLENRYWQETQEIANEFYLNVRRFAGGAFHHAQLGKKLETLDTDKLFREFDSNDNGSVNATELREGFRREFCRRLTQKELDQVFGGDAEHGISKKQFAFVVQELLEGGRKQ